MGITSEFAIIDRKDQPQGKVNIMNALNEIAASGSGFSRYTAPTNIEIGVAVYPSNMKANRN